MSKKVIKQTLAGILIVINCSAAGYYDSLPTLGDTTRPKQEVKAPVENIPALAPKAKRPIMQATIYKQNTYKHYLKDLEELLPYLDGIKKAIETNPENKTQLFCAKENLLNLYVISLETKYKNKPERNYETYKQTITLNKQLVDLSSYVRYIEKYDRLLQDYSIRQEHNTILSSRFKTALTRLNYLVTVLKENLSEE
ncbi:MAG: hypothetical protein WCK67_06050 [bacterium]